MLLNVIYVHIPTSLRMGVTSASIRILYMPIYFGMPYRVIQNRTESWLIFSEYFEHMQLQEYFNRKKALTFLSVNSMSVVFC